MVGLGGRRCYRPSMGEIVNRSELRRLCEEARKQGRRVVFTNGCFDLIHAGHVRFLRAARAFGDLLVVGLNDDDSVRRLGKGEDRPILGESERAEILAALEMVDLVSLFPEDTPQRLIDDVLPDVLVKGQDWSPEEIVGADLVRSRGGTVRTIPYHEGFSTTAIIEQVRRQR